MPVTIGKSARKANKSNVNKYQVKKFSGTQEIARRKLQIERGIIEASKPFVPSIRQSSAKDVGREVKPHRSGGGYSIEGIYQSL